MKAEAKSFKVSVRLKDLIGRDLITDDFVAVFELVKNSFDAHARKVQIYFDEDCITIIDDGKGMSHADILNKWLVVAYSAKREGTEDADYRDRIGEKNRPFAGYKGVGRFSCDRLGEELTLSSRATGQPVQVLEVDWRDFEGDSKKEFDTIDVALAEAPTFPRSVAKKDPLIGTMLQIGGLRSEWDREKLRDLKRELTKLIDPFSSGPKKFEIEIIATAQQEDDDKDAQYNKQVGGDKPLRLIVNGKIENPILNILSKRTTLIKVELTEDGKFIESTLEDRGELIYHIREPNPYEGIQGTDLKADIYYLNKSAKMVFYNRMGLPSVQFGSIFLFRNGFRVFPIGAENDDFFGLNRRKMQGQRRFLGGRELIGRVDIKGVGGFDEATSRNQGLIRNPQVDELIECINHKCVRRLERYVVDISWKDRFDQDVADISRMQLDESSALVSQLVSRLSATEGVELIEYTPQLVRIVDEKSEAFETSLKALELLADQTGDANLRSRINDARARIRALQVAEAEAQEAKRRAESRALAAEAAAEAAEVKFGEERERNAFLVAAASLDHDTILNLHHQIIIHASDVHIGIKRMMVRLRSNAPITKEEWIDFLESVSYRNSQILTAARFATKGGYKQQSNMIKADIAGYIRDYIETISSLWSPRGVSVSVESDGKALEVRFRPLEVGILIDNLVNNAVKANSSSIGFFTMISKGPKPELILTVADDGAGWAKTLVPLERVFDKGMTTTDGSGLGLFHVKQVIESLGGLVEAHREPYSDALDGAHLTLRIPS